MCGCARSPQNGVIITVRLLELDELEHIGVADKVTFTLKRLDLLRVGGFGAQKIDLGCVGLVIVYFQLQTRGSGLRRMSEEGRHRG